MRPVCILAQCIWSFSDIIRQYVEHSLFCGMLLLVVLPAGFVMSHTVCLSPGQGFKKLV